jgi:hypothetical protein
LQRDNKKPTSVLQTDFHKVPFSFTECLPPSIFSGGTEQVDMVRKLQEDPLFAIKKKENETRSQILKNPVKLKQLRELVIILQNIVYIIPKKDCWLISLLGFLMLT